MYRQGGKFNKKKNEKKKMKADRMVREEFTQIGFCHVLYGLVNVTIEMLAVWK